MVDPQAEDVAHHAIGRRVPVEVRVVVPAVAPVVGFDRLLPHIDRILRPSWMHWASCEIVEDVEGVEGVKRCRVEFSASAVGGKRRDRKMKSNRG